MREHAEHQRTSELIDIGRRRLHFICAGTGQPVVILDAGLGGASAEWDEILERLAAFTSVCCYDRAGMGASDPRPKQPHTTQDNVADLHALLGAAAIPPPYILVGHSQAAFTVSLYAYQHPSEVAGLVLVDPPHPDDPQNYLEQLPAFNADEPKRIQRLRRFYSGGYKDPTKNAEQIDVPASHLQVKLIHSLGNVPLIVLTAGDLLRHPLLVPDLAPRFYEVHVQSGERWASLSQRGSHQIFEQSGHQMQKDMPEVIITAILQVKEMASRTA